MEKFLNPSVEAQTLSVMQSVSDSVTCGITINEEYCNVSLNFELDTARILGYPINWGVHDQHVDHYDSDSPTYEDVIEELDELVPNIPAYVSKETEKEIFRLLKVALTRQFEDPMWEETLSPQDQQIALEKIDAAIRSL